MGRIGAQRKLLILTDSARDSSYLESVVTRGGLQPNVDVADGAWNGSFKGYYAVILNNVASAHIAPAAQNALIEYVADGGSLAMAGGDAKLRPWRMAKQSRRAHHAGPHEAAGAARA